MARERADLMNEAARRIDRSRRGLGYTLVVVFLTLSFGLLPLTPHSGPEFGVATVWQGLACVAPSIVITWLAFFLYRRYGSASRLYRASESLEALSLYCSTLAFCYATGTTRTAMWGVPAYTALFCAVSAPAVLRRNGLAIMFATFALVLLCLATKKNDLALVASMAGAVSQIAFGVVAARARRTIAAEAERNVLWFKLNEDAVHFERERIASTLQTHVGRRLGAFMIDVDDAGAPDLMRELAGVVRPSGETFSLEALAEMVDTKCRALCTHYERPPVRSGVVLLDSDRSLAVLRVAQELVRNAVTHGQAQRVRVELDYQGSTVSLRVRDDGRGLSSQEFAHATGGLANAKRWLQEWCGVLELVSTGPRTGTDLCAIMTTERSTQ